jgi:predicted RND superfamily exporter protein
MTSARGMEYLGQWCVGSLVLAAAVGAVGTVTAYGLARLARQKMKLDLYTRSTCGSASHRKLVLTATLLVTIVSLVISSRVDLEEDVLAVLPQHDQLVDEYRYTIRKFRQVDRVYIRRWHQSRRSRQTGRRRRTNFMPAALATQYVLRAHHVSHRT